MFDGSRDILMPFAIGIVTAPWSVSGIVIVILYVILVESLRSCFWIDRDWRLGVHITRCDDNYTLRGFIRKLALIGVGVGGWILGRVMFQRNVVDDLSLRNIMD